MKKISSKKNCFEKNIRKNRPRPPPACLAKAKNKFVSSEQEPQPVTEWGQEKESGQQESADTLSVYSLFPCPRDSYFFTNILINNP